MGYGSELKGHNKMFYAPAGEEERVAPIQVFDNGTHLVTAWEFSDEEMEQIVKTKKIYVSFWSRGLPPHFVGSESLVRMVISDYGLPLPKQE